MRMLLRHYSLDIILNLSSLIECTDKMIKNKMIKKTDTCYSKSLYLKLYYDSRGKKNYSYSYLTINIHIYLQP